METKEIIEKAIQGGYKSKKLDYFVNSCDEVVENCSKGTKDTLGTLLLDPKFWEAVGKMDKCLPESFVMMHEMIDFLCKGKSLEDYIKTL